MKKYIRPARPGQSGRRQEFTPDYLAEGERVLAPWMALAGVSRREKGRSPPLDTPQLSSLG